MSLYPTASSSIRPVFLCSDPTGLSVAQMRWAPFLVYTPCLLPEMLLTFISTPHTHLTIAFHPSSFLSQPIHSTSSVKPSLTIYIPLLCQLVYVFSSNKLSFFLFFHLPYLKTRMSLFINLVPF